MWATVTVERVQKDHGIETEYVGHNVNGKYRVQRSLYTFCDMKLKMHINKTWMFSEWLLWVILFLCWYYFQTSL